MYELLSYLEGMKVALGLVEQMESTEMAHEIIEEILRKIKDIIEKEEENAVITMVDTTCFKMKENND